MLKVGVIGCGGIGNQHANAYSQIEQVELVALIDSNIERAEALVEKYGGKAYKSIDDVPEKLDLVSVVTPPSTHYPIVMDLLDRGIPVFCEKPITTDVDEAKALLKKSKETGLQVGIGFKMRYEAVFAKAKELVGEVGELFGLSVCKNQPFKEDYRTEWVKKTGCMYELSIHDYDLINWIMDAVPESVEADLRYSEGWTREDRAFLNVEYSNGVKGQLMSSYSMNSKWAPNDITMVFVGDKGTMRVERPDRILLATLDGVKAVDIEPINGMQVFIDQIQTFVDCLIAGKEYKPGIEEGVVNTILVEAANKAFKDGKKVALADM